MTPVLILTAALTAAAATLIVHALYRGARREVTVATLKPFESESRPRLTLSSLTQRALLASRLALIALVAAMAVYERPAADAAAAGRDVVAVVPGTTPPSRTGDARVVWLDGSQTPVAASPRRDDVTAGALLALAQTLDGETALSVSGALPARDWPAETPRFGRPIDWLGGARRPAADAGWVAAGAPPRLVVTGDDAALADAVRAALSLWRGAGLLPGDLRVEFDGSTDGAAVIALDASPGDARDWYANVVHARQARGSDVVYDPASTPGAFATALWHALTARAGERPASGTVVAPAPMPESPESLVRGSVVRRAGTPLAPAWLLLVVAVFAAERGLAARGAAH